MSQAVFLSLCMLNGTNIAIFFKAPLSQLSVLHILHAHPGYGDTVRIKTLFLLRCIMFRGFGNRHETVLVALECKTTAHRNSWRCEQNLVITCQGKGPSLPEPFLPSRVPELQLHPDPWLHFYEVNVKVHPHCLVDGLQEQVFSVALDQGGLPHRGVAQHDDPELVLPLSQVHCCCSKDKMDKDIKDSL